MESFIVSSFYTFFKATHITSKDFRDKLYQKALNERLKGLFILSPEGMNCSFSGPHLGVEVVKNYLENLCPTKNSFKDNTCHFNPFSRLKVALRKELIAFNPSLVPQHKRNHLSSSQWQKVIETENVTIIDIRNHYETKLGRFKGAVDPKLESFQNFSHWIQKTNIKRDKKTLIYCTGGVRCEKALLEMKNKGFQHVYQLEGGILAYLQKFPYKNFEGECFVFDHRASVDQKLEPSSTYYLCVHCGDPGSSKIQCKQCKNLEFVCSRCLEKDDQSLQTCSKNCRYHYKLKHKYKKPHKKALQKRVKPLF